MTSVPSILIPALWIAWLVYWWIESLRAHGVRREELISSRPLGEAFPEDYDRYRKEVAALIPFLY